MLPYYKFKEKGLCVACGKERQAHTRCDECHEKHLGYQRSAKQKAYEKGLCRECCRQPYVSGHTKCEQCLANAQERNKKRHKFLREACIVAYGSVCACCGLSNSKYLQLDHINNDGAQHRKSIRGGSDLRNNSMYSWAYANNFPSILQLLCANCHQAKTVGQPCSDEDHESMIWQKPS